MSLGFPFGKRAVQIAGHRATHIRQLHILIFMLVHEMGGQILAKAAL